MTCDVKKVTYSMYTCYTCCMGREMMEMYGRDSAKYQKSKLRDMIGINWILNEEKDKSPNSGLLLP